MNQQQDGSSSPKVCKPPTLEEVLRQDYSINYFIRFVKKEYSVENVFFWLDVEVFKRLERKDDIVLQARNIYNKYINTESQLPINLDVEEKREIARIMDDPEHNIEQITAQFFDNAQQHIFLMMKENSFPRFLKSDEYKELMGMIPTVPRVSNSNNVQNIVHERDREKSKSLSRRLSNSYAISKLVGRNRTSSK
jgi:hypothetical protein